MNTNFIKKELDDIQNSLIEINKHYSMITSVNFDPDLATEALNLSKKIHKVRVEIFSNAS